MSRMRASQFIRRGRSSVLLAAIVVVLSSGLLTALVQRTSAQLKGPRPFERQVTRIVKTLLEQYHLSRRNLDDEISGRGFDTFLKQLDPNKLYFYQHDVDQFSVHREAIDDAIRAADVRLAYAIFALFLERLDQRVELAQRLLESELDFTKDEEIIADRDLMVYAKDEAEAHERWRKRIKYELLDRKAEKLEFEEAKEKIRKKYVNIAKRWRLTDNDELLEMFLTAFLTAYDPHSTYMSASTQENFEIAMKLELDGIGASLRFADGYTVVHKIIPGGAADKDGRLKPEDRIVEVGQGDAGELEDVVEMKLGDVVHLIRGKRGTVVRLGVTSASDTDTKVYNITRARIQLKDSEARSQIIESGQKADGSSYRIGVIDLPSFYMDMKAAKMGLRDFKSTHRDVTRLLQDFKRDGVDAVVINLRQNGGGSLTEAVKLTGLFIDQGPVVQVKGPDGRVQPYHDLDRGMMWDGPLIVMVSKFSASASEIFAGAIQDYRRGLVVGDQATHGKGTVQQLFDLATWVFKSPNNANAAKYKYGALKLTIQQFYRASGASTQNRGVLADVELPSLTSHLEIGESDLPFAMAFDQVNASPHLQNGMVDGNLVQQLAVRSKQRVQDSEDFRDVFEDIDRYHTQKDRKTVSLVEEAFLAERAELDSEKEEQDKLQDEVNDPNRPVFKRDFYNNEVLAVAVDYIELLNSRVAQTR